MFQPTHPNKTLPSKYRRKPAAMRVTDSPQIRTWHQPQMYINCTITLTDYFGTFDLVLGTNVKLSSSSLEDSLDRTSTNSQQKLLLYIDMHNFCHHVRGTYIINPHGTIQTVY